MTTLFTTTTLVTAIAVLVAALAFGAATNGPKHCRMQAVLVATVFTLLSVWAAAMLALIYKELRP